MKKENLGVKNYVGGYFGLLILRILIVREFLKGIIKEFWGPLLMSLQNCVQQNFISPQSLMSDIKCKLWL